MMVPQELLLFYIPNSQFITILDHGGLVVFCDHIPFIPENVERQVGVYSKVEKMWGILKGDVVTIIICCDGFGEILSPVTRSIIAQHA